jgi:amphi-Trp domain-containing protein
MSGSELPAGHCAERFHGRLIFIRSLLGTMTERVLFESERVLDRSAVASYLRTVADKLDSGEAVTLEAGSDSVTLEPPESVEFEVKAEHEGPEGDGELSLELELEWDENGDDDALSIK